jgi:hypothetical protein
MLPKIFRFVWSSIRTKGLPSLQVGNFHFAIYKPVPVPLLLLKSTLELLFRGTGQASLAIQLESPQNRRMFFPLKLNNVLLVKVMRLGYICPLWSEPTQRCTQNFILFLFVIQRQHRFCGNPPHLQFFCLFTGLQVLQKELTTNILARQQHKNEHSITAPPTTLICSKSIQWCLAAYSCIISCYSSMQPA